MNIDDPRHPWSRLTAAARRVSDESDAAAPYGFSTRLAALALANGRRASSLYERFALRAVGVAGLLAVLSVAANFRLLTEQAMAEPAEEYDPVAVLLDG